MRQSTVVEDPPIRQEPHEELCPYLYPEFSGASGAHYLKKVLRQILPMALYRTWEIFAEHQARGNDCYLSLARVAALAGRSLRTVQKNVASLQARQLLVERAERKAFRTPDGQTVSRLVIIKDFTALYRLAHEYHEWLQAEEMIPPERAFVALLTCNSSLVAKLRRFNNYRRLLYNHLPGSGRLAQEEDYWFTEYHAEANLVDVRQQPPARELPHHHSELPLEEPKGPSKSSSKAPSKVTPKRINESSHRDVQEGDSFDSASPVSENALRGKDSRQRLPQPTRNCSGKTPEGGLQPDPPRQGTPRPSARSEPESIRRRPLSVRKREETSQARRATLEARVQANQGQTRQQCPDPALGSVSASPQPPDYLLARSFLHEIAVPFGDRNPKGSVTRILNIVVQASLPEAEVVLCLVRAYTIARDTRTIRPAHCEPETGQANRMPLFCTLFERFVQARLHQDKWNYSWQQWEDELATDDRLLVWWTENQGLLVTSVFDPSKPDSGTPGDQDEVGEETPRVLGWARREAAHSWGERLLEVLVTAGYNVEVRVHLEGQWYQLILVGDGEEWVLDTPQRVLAIIEHVSHAEVGSHQSSGRHCLH